MLFVLNKKVLILFSTMGKMNKISTFIPHLSVALHLSPHFTGNGKGLYATMKRWVYLTFEGRKVAKKGSKNNFFAEKMKKVG